MSLAWSILAYVLACLGGLVGVIILLMLALYVGITLADRLDKRT